MKKKLLFKKQLLVVALGLSSPVFAEDQGNCNIDATVVKNLQSKLATVVTQSNGGLFSPNRMVRRGR